MVIDTLQTWHRLVRTNDASGLDALLAEDATFHSPVVHTPQRGKKLAATYLAAAFDVFFNPSFRYVREIVGPSEAVLEFETEVDGILVNGVDFISWGADGRITAFKVMLRPLKAIQVIHQRMAAALGPGPAQGTVARASPGTPLFDHVKFGVTDIAASQAFFLQALEPIGMAIVSEGPPAYGVELSANDKTSLCLFHTTEKPAHLHLAFVAERRAQVDAFHRAALAAGAADNGAPGLRPRYHANYYAAFVLGPDGHNIEVVCHRPEA